MRQLTVVAVSDDGTHLLLASSSDAAKPTHEILIDDRLAAALRGDLDNGTRRESALTPKEIQARLRAGDTPEQVAKAANVPVNRVLRFFGPVASERDRIITQAQAATMRRTRGPAATMTLGEAVERRLATTTGLHRESVEWTAKRREDGAWVVALRYTARGGTRSAAWLWQPAGRDLTALDPAATRIVTGDQSGSRTSTVSAATATASARTRRRPAVAKPRRPAAAAAAAAATPAVEEAGPPRVRREPKAIPPTPTRSGRVPVPAWDDVLFGAARPATDDAAEPPAGATKTRSTRTPPTPASTPARGRRRS
ncbi:MAG TPA: septation protein SepH [Mycobacteriales bacterium]|nr:septation protein SepH [Mycobacteriales bacterium]